MEQLSTTANVRFLPVWKHAPTCPLPWSRTLRRNLRLSREEAQIAIEWLLRRGWRSEGKWWVDPLDDDTWSLAFAVQLQAIREAQTIVTRAGYRLSGGSLKADGTWTIVCRVAGPDDRDVTLTRALARLERAS